MNTHQKRLITVMRKPTYEKRVAMLRQFGFRPNPDKNRWEWGITTELKPACWIIDEMVAWEVPISEK